MNKEEIKDYLKRVDELDAKLTGEDKETLQWLIFGYNQCAKLLNETEQQCKKQKEVIDKMNKLLQQEQDAMTTKFHYDIVGLINALLDILKEVSE